MKLAERIWVSDVRKVKKLQKLIFDLAHFRNLVLIFIHEYHKKTGKWLTSSTILYSLMSKPNSRSLTNKEKMEKINEIKSNLDDNLEEWLEKIKEQKNRVDNNYTAQNVLRQIERDFRSYFESLKEYKESPGKFNGKPNPHKPKKLKNLAHFTAELNLNALEQNGRRLTLKLRINGRKRFVVKLSNDFKVTSARICYCLGGVYVDVVREVEVPSVNPLGHYVAGIDINLDNLLVIGSTNPSLDTLIITGGELKAFNQWFNKLRSKLQSEADILRNKIESLKQEGKDVSELEEKERGIRSRIRHLCTHRKKWIDNHFHRLTKYLALYLYVTGHSLIVVGRGALECKQNCELGRTTEKFVQIPFRNLIDKLKYKLSSLGIEVKEVDEDYTSQASCINDDIVGIHEKLAGGEYNFRLTGKRVERGLYRDTIVVDGKEKEIMYNADCNGSFNIMRLGAGAKLPKLTELFDFKTLMRKLCNPVKIRMFKFVELMQRVIPRSLQKWRVGDSPVPLGTGFSPVALVRSFHSTSFDNKRLHCYATG